jgi:hypothetical protein
MKNGLLGVIRRFASLPIFRMPPGAGKGPEWAVWVAGICATLSIVALVEAAIATLNGQSPKTSYAILFGSFAVIAIPFRALRLVPQAYCLLALAAIAIPLVLTLP